MLHDTPPPCAYVRTCRLRGHTVLEFHGEIDIAAAIQVTPHVDHATARPTPALVIDLTLIEFFDCSGLRVLSRAHGRVLAQGGHLLLVCSHSLTLRILYVTRLAEQLHPVHTLGEALSQYAAAHD